MTKEFSIVVAVVAPRQCVWLHRIENTLAAMQSVVGGRIELFAVVRGDDSLAGVCNEEFAFLNLSFCRFNPATCADIYGTFFVASERDGDEEREFCSLSRVQVDTIERLFGPVAGLELLG